MFSAKVLNGREICLTTNCVEETEEEILEDLEWDDWVRPALCIGIMLVAVVFFSFMYFGRSWLEGTVKVRIYQEILNIRITADSDEKEKIVDMGFCSSCSNLRCLNLILMFKIS